MKAPHILVVLVTATALGASYLLIPRNKELGEIYLKTNQDDRAEKNFVELYQKGDRSPTTILGLVQISLDHGHPDDAISYLKSYAQEHPNDPAVLQRLANVYHEAMLPRDYLEALQSLQSVAPTKEQARSLEQQYRFLGPEDGHATAEEEFIAHYPAEEDDYVRLALYQASTSQLEQAADTLDRFLKLHPASIDPNTIRLQIGILLTLKRNDDAFALAQSYINLSDSPGYKIDIALLFRNEGDEAHCLAFLKLEADKEKNSPELALFYVETLADMHRLADAESYIAARQKTGEDVRYLAPAYISVLLTKGDLNRAFSVAQSYDFSTLPAATIEQLLEGAAYNNRLDLIQKVTPYLSGDYYPAHPLLAAQIAFAQGNRILALRYLDRVDPVTVNDPAELVDLELKLGQTDRALAQLSALLEKGNASPEFVSDITLDMIQQGRYGEISKINNGQLLTQVIAYWRQRFDHSTALKDKEIALDALLALKQDQAVLPTLKGLAEKDPGHWASLYQDALKRLGRNEELNAYLVKRALDPQTAATTRRDLAYTLLDAGDKENAEAAFRLNATLEAPDGSDVQELLFLWGPTPTEIQLDWITARAASANPDEEKKWLAILMDLNATTRIVSVYQAHPAPQAQDIYIEALLRTDDKAALNQVLETAIAETQDASTLQRLGEMAQEAGNIKLARQAFAAEIKIDPHNLKAYRALGLIDLGLLDYADAKTELEFYHNSGTSDYESNYAYGEILLHERQTKMAKAYFMTALSQLEQIGTPTYQENLTRAALLHRLGRNEDAKTLYASLLAAHSDDRDLRADYGTMLFEMDEDEAAQNVVVIVNDDFRTSPRLELLEAQIDARNGAPEDARALLQDRLKQAPDDVETNDVYAGVEAQQGRWRHAKTLYNHILAVDPNNQDARDALADLNWTHQAHAGVDAEYRDLTGYGIVWATITSAEVPLTNALTLGAEYDADHLFSGSVRHPDGAVAPAHLWSTASTLSLRYDTEEGDALQGFLFASHKLGLGGSYQMPDAWGITTFRGEFDRANWDYIEGRVNNGTRDRASVLQTTNFSHHWSGALELGYNVYNLGGERDVANGPSATGQLRYALTPDSNPVWSIIYSLDAEYSVRTQKRIDNTGQEYEPLPLTNREAHIVTLDLTGGAKALWEALCADEGADNETSDIASDQRNDRGIIDLFTGAGIDRYGTAGPVVGGSYTLRQGPVEMQLRGSYTRGISREATSALIGGGYLTVRF